MRVGLALTALLAAAVAVGGVANRIEADHLASGWDRVQHGTEGAEVEVGNYRVLVRGASASPQLEDPETTSPASFVVVDLAYATTDAWDTPEEVVLLDDDGRTFATADGFGSDGQPWAAGPDIWLGGTLLFEVPPGMLDDLTLAFRPEMVDGRLSETTLQVPLTVELSPEPLALERATVLARGQR